MEINELEELRKLANKIELMNVTIGYKKSPNGIAFEIQLPYPYTANSCLTSTVFVRQSTIDTFNLDEEKLHNLVLDKIFPNKNQIDIIKKQGEILFKELPQ